MIKIGVQLFKKNRTNSALLLMPIFFINIEFKNMKTLNISALFGLTLLLISRHIQSKTRFRIMQMICETSNKTVLRNISCRVRTFKRESFYTIRATLIRKVGNLKVTYSNYRKYIEGYQRLLHLKDIEACKIIRNIENASIPFIQSYFDHLKSNVRGNYLSACNMIRGEVSMINGTFANLTAVNFYPEGYYMGVYNLYDELDDKIANITFMSHISK